MIGSGFGLGYLFIILIYLCAVAIAAVVLYFVVRFAVGAAIRDNAEAVARAVSAGIKGADGGTAPPTP